MTEQDILKATRDELKEQAAILGLEVKERAKLDELQQIVADALGVTLPDRKADKKPVATGEDRVWLKIEKNQLDKLPVPIAVNGKTILVERGKWVHVKREYVQCLENAVSYEIDTETKEHIAVPSFPFQWAETKPNDANIRF